MPAFARSISPLALGLGFVLAAPAARAECTKDTDCKGSRVCESGICTTSTESNLTPQGEDVPRFNHAADSPQDPVPVDERPRDKALMVAGIIVASLGGVSGITAITAIAFKSSCDATASISGDDCSRYMPTIIGGSIGFVALGAVGVTMILSGAKSVPVYAQQPTLRVSSWAAPNAAGLHLSGSF